MNGGRSLLDQVSRYLEGRLDAQETKDLEAALRQDADLRRDFLEYLNVDAALVEQAALLESEAGGPHDTGIVGGLPRGVSLAVAAAVLFAAMAATWVVRSVYRGGHGEGVVAVEVLSADQADIENHEAVVRGGERLKVSRLRLRQGSLRLRLASGVVLDLSGPSEGVFEGPAWFRLVRGGLNVDVGARGRGFTVVTEAGDIVDLGTRFAVNVSQDGEADIAVFAGEVRVRNRRADASNGTVTISQGEALRLHIGQQADRLVMVPLKREEMAMDIFGETPRVVSVTDNVEEADFRRFYGIVAGGLAEGTLVYTDKPNVAWRPVEGTPFPPELLGADVVRTFHTDRHELDLKITLRLAQSSVVYVMHDVRKPALDWLERGFEDTGLRLRSGPWKPQPVVRNIAADARGEIYVECTVWRKNLPAGGNIELGPPHVRGEGGAKVMFGIAVKPCGSNTGTREQTGGGP